MKLSTLGLSARQACVFILATLAIAVPAVSAQGLSSSRYIPHIARGQGWTTELHVFNVCSSPGVYRIFFFGSDGHRKAFLLEGAADLQRGSDRVDHIAGSDGQEIDREVHVWRFVDTGQELLQGYGRIFDDNGGRTSGTTDGGCVVVDVFYKQHLPNGQVLSTAIPLQRLSGLGSVLAFNSTGGCDTGVATRRRRGRCLRQSRSERSEGIQYFGTDPPHLSQEGGMIASSGAMEAQPKRIRESDCKKVAVPLQVATGSVFYVAATKAT